MIKRGKEDYIVLTLAVIMVGIILGIAFVVLWQPKQLPGKKPFGTAPTAYPTARAQNQDKPELITLPGSKTLLFNARDGNKIADLKENRRVLSDKDIQSKDKLLEKLFAVAPRGYVYTSKNVRVEYTNPDDQFRVEIMTTDIDNAKKETIDWFLSQGFTNDGLCKMPIMFFLSDAVIRSLEGSHYIFSPIVPSCK